MSLTEALRAGAPEVFGALYDEYAAQLYAYCHIMVGDEAAEAVRDAFIAVARHPGSAPADDDALPAWLHALARAECVRRGALTRKPVATPTADPLRRALTRLRPEHREALALNAALRPEEIARVIGVARDTAEELVRVAKRRLEQAAASVGGREAHDSAMLAALSEGALHRLVTLGYEPPARQRERVLFSCAAAEHAPDGALLFDADGMPIPLDGLLDSAESPTDPFTRVSLDEPATAPLRQVDQGASAPSRPEASRSESSRVAGAHSAGEEAPTVVRITHAKPKKEPFLSRRRDGLFEVAGIAACVAAATGVLALWPSPHQGGASNMDGTSLFLHRGSAASRSAEPSTPAGRTPPPQAATSKPGASPTPKPTTAASGAPATTPPPVTGPTADPADTPPPNGGSNPGHPGHPGNPGHPTSPPSSPPTSPTDSPTTTPTPSDSPTDDGSDSPVPDPSGS